MLRRSKRARESFHPLHRAVVEDGGFRATLGPDDVTALLASLATHDETQRKPLPPPLTEVVAPMLRVMVADLPPGGTVDVGVDVRGTTIKEKTTPRTEVPLTQDQQYRRVRKVSRSVSTDPWLWMRARLRDKSTLEVTITDTVRDDKVTKTGASGKTKIKRKVRRTQQVTSKLTLPAGRQIFDPGETPGFCSVSTKHGERHPVVTAKSRFDLDHRPQMPYLQALLIAMGEPFRWAPPIDLLKGAS